LPDGWSIDYETDRSAYAIRDGDPLSARMERVIVQRYSWPGHEVVISLSTTMTGDADEFHLHRDCTATLDRRLHFREESTRAVPRGL
jgi:hypothetical protein